MSVPTPEQCLAARAMLRMTRDHLAEISMVAVATLADFETGRRRPHPRTLAAIRSVLESSGVEFIAEGSPSDSRAGPGVRLRNGA